MFRQGQNRLYHVQIMHLTRIDLAECFRQKIGLFLVVALDVDLITGLITASSKATASLASTIFPSLT